jgi:hypothetical protein
MGCLLAASLMAIGSCQNSTDSTASDKDKLPITDSIYRSGTGWGYNVYVDHKLYIKQPLIPAVQGRQYFKTEEDATKVATLVITKIMQHHFPPRVDIEEMKQLHVID